MARIPIDVPKKWQGKKKLFETFASARYPKGRGELLRFKPGRIATVEPAVGGILAALAFLVGPVGLLIATANPDESGFKMRYPKKVADIVPPDPDRSGSND